MSSFIKCRNIVKEYKVGTNIVRAVDKLSFEINKGEVTVILGPSGSGKTTLLNLLGGMDLATSGELLVDSTDVVRLSAKQLNDYRRADIGFVFQFYNLMPNLTARENVELARKVGKNTLSVDEILDKVGLSHRKDHFPAELSGGEQQRVSIARALCKNPKIVLCDEPTGALDSETGRLVLELLQSMCAKEGNTVVIVTHNSNIAEIANRVIYLKNGKVEKTIDNSEPASMKEVSW